MVKNLLYILVLTIVLCSCEKEYDIADFPEHTPKIVVNCLFNPDESWTVRLSSSKSELDISSEYKTINNADVKIYEDDILLETLTYNVTTEKYEGITIPQIGKKYSIEASAPNFTTVNASDIIPAFVPIDSWEIDSEIINNNYGGDDYYIYSFNITLTDPINTNNYYATDLTTHYFDTLFNLQYGDTILDFYDIHNDLLFNGQNYKINLRKKLPTYEGELSYYTINIYLRSISETAYNYFNSLGIQVDNSGDPFSQPVPVYNNIENGFGIFAGYSEDIITIN